jgi:hypothetical protein
VSFGKEFGQHCELWERIYIVSFGKRKKNIKTSLIAFAF